MIGVHLVHHYGAVFASVSGKIALSIALEVKATDRNPTLHRLLPNCGVDRLTVPCDVTREPDIDGYKPSHKIPSFECTRRARPRVPPAVHF